MNQLPRKTVQQIANEINALYKARKIVETGLAYTEAEELIYRLRGFTQSTTDKQLWNRWEYV